MAQPQLPLLYLGRGFAYVHTGRHDEAVEDFIQSAKLYRPLAPLVAAARGYAVARRGAQREAAGQFAAALAKNRKAGIIYVFRGEACVAQQRYEEALEDFRKAVQMADDSPETHHALASLLAACPEPDIADGASAVEHAARACELTGNQHWAYLDTLGSACARSGDFAAAIRHATEALRLAPADRQPAVRERLALYEAGKTYQWPATVE